MLAQPQIRPATAPDPVRSYTGAPRARAVFRQHGQFRRHSLIFWETTLLLLLSSPYRDAHGETGSCKWHTIPFRGGRNARRPTLVAALV
jgi:hypothetical protein